MREYFIADKLEYPEIYRLIKQAFGDNANYPEDPTIVAKDEKGYLGIISTKHYKTQTEIVSFVVFSKIKAFIGLKLIDLLLKNLEGKLVFSVKKENKKWDMVFKKFGYKQYAEDKNYNFYRVEI